MYQPPAQKSVGARPFDSIHPASRRVRSACSGPASEGRACAGETKWVCSPIGPRSAARCARSSQRCSSSAGARVGRSQQRRDPEAARASTPGATRTATSTRRRAGARHGRTRRRTASSPAIRPDRPGVYLFETRTEVRVATTEWPAASVAISVTARSRGTPHSLQKNHQDSADTVSFVCGICGLLAPDGTPDPALVSRMNAALVHRGPGRGLRRRLRTLRARPPPAPRDRPRDGEPAGRERGRRRRRRLQRRALQLPRAARGAVPARRSRHRRHARDPAPVRGARRSSSPTASPGCSRSRSGTRRASGSCSRATTSARSRSSTRGSTTARSHSRPR